ncbi:hypothetical protein G4B88_015018 [Cannabis sativa]|uniref:Uncharacterized protein n=1 Tax=Cannabis sativa TaxID=3483 RepID=A0A7J6E7Y4_CANSA|nr:hypothetical protein G4B88_015018 [Cannabis sativa]
MVNAVISGVLDSLISGSELHNSRRRGVLLKLMRRIVLSNQPYSYVKSLIASEPKEKIDGAIFDLVSFEQSEQWCGTISFGLGFFLRIPVLGWLLQQPHIRSDDIEEKGTGRIFYSEGELNVGRYPHDELGFVRNKKQLCMHNIVGWAVVSYSQAFAASLLATRADGSAEGSPAILLAPSQGLVGVPSGTECTHLEQVPVIILWIVQMVCCSNIARTLSRCTNHHCTHHHHRHRPRLPHHHHSH